MNLQVRLIDSPRELETIKSSWDELYDSIPAPQGHPFNSASWLFPYTKLLERQGSLLQVFTVYKGDKLVGVAPLQVRRHKLTGIDRVQFIGHEFSDYCDLMCSKNLGKLVIETLVCHWKTLFGVKAIFDFHHLHESSATPLFLRDAVEKQEGQVHEIPWEKAPALNLEDGGGTKMGILGKILSKKHARKRIREMEKLGRVRFSIMSADDDLESHLERLFYYHKLRWYQKKTYVDSMNEDRQKVFMESIRQMAQEGRSEIATLIIDDLPFAYAVALKTERVYYYLMPVHNVFSRYSPGTALLCHIFRSMMDSGYKELDFTIGEEFYKTRFSNILRQNRRVIFAFNSSKVFAKILELIDRMRRGENFMKRLRSWRTRAHQISYDFKDTLCRKTGQLRRLDYKGISLPVKSMFSVEKRLIYRLNLDDLSDDREVEGNFCIQEISAVEAIKFICQFHQCDSPGLWGDLLKREIEGTECYGAFMDGRLIHTSWVTDKEVIFVKEIGISTKPENGDCWVFDCNTLPQYRGRGALAQTCFYIAQKKMSAGHRSLCIFGPLSKVSSIARRWQAYAMT